jgi:hypothetical protein
MAYLFDTNTFLEARSRYYAFAVCPAYWDWLIRECASGHLLSIDDVKAELEDPEIKQWATVNPQLFLPMDAPALVSLVAVSQWVNSHAQYHQAAKAHFLSRADPRLIAFAMAHGHTLVTLERPAPGAKASIKIPDVCDAHNVPWKNTFEVLTALHARFVLEALPVAGN